MNGFSKMCQKQVAFKWHLLQKLVTQLLVKCYIIAKNLFKTSVWTLEGVVLSNFYKNHTSQYFYLLVLWPAIRPTNRGCMGPEISENTGDHCLNMNQMIASLDGHIASMANYVTIMQN